MTRFKTILLPAVPALLLALTALPAAAHPGHAASGLAAGFVHPFGGLDHLLALLAVGLWSRQQARGYVLPPLFLVLMALGAASGLQIAWLETSVAATVLVLGTLGALALRLPPSLAMIVVAVSAFLHGLAHGNELAGAASGTGFVLASLVLLGVGALAPLDGRQRRLGGAAIGAAGLCLLAGVV